MLSASTSTFFAAPILSATPPPPKTSTRAHFRPISAFAAGSTCTSDETATASYLGHQKMTSLYEILGIPAVATCQEIKSAYRRLARVCHPDVAAIERKDTSADEFMKIHAAYSTLSDPEKRADYDRKFMRRSRPLSTASGYSGYYTRRNWETDQCW
ncbi:unnamed protein product [Prunus armeniaca]|uniref:J domain-containing protein n=1 Tax=Prunus armeniaca TaxID=36596 RepID=A0A6J5VI31_PRUAR|nr:hypothetical protein GBA52_025690 [Prunus armeniaca]CAB4287803.1 unnamed protein product [Prunus armeniaca]